MRNQDWARLEVSNSVLLCPTLWVLLCTTQKIFSPFFGDMKISADRAFQSNKGDAMGIVE